MCGVFRDVVRCRTTVNKVCASGMKATALAAMGIQVLPPLPFPTKLRHAEESEVTGVSDGPE